MQDVLSCALAWGDAAGMHHGTAARESGMRQGLRTSTWRWAGPLRVEYESGAEQADRTNHQLHSLGGDGQRTHGQ